MSVNFIENGGVTSPKGFRAAGVCAGLKVSGADDMALVCSDFPCSFTGSFTSNLVPAAPVQICKERVLKQDTIRAMIFNSGAANACTGLEGLKNAEKMAELTAAELGINQKEVMVASTGHIGNQLPMDTIAKGISMLAKALDPKGGADAARAIMTTDTRPKEIAVRFTAGEKEVTIGGMCKGAGMIAPNMKVPHATMLCCITTDCKISNRQLSALLAEVIEDSFNKVTVDGDMSTNDTVILMANGASGAEIAPGSEDERNFKEALRIAAKHLARAIAMDGEGATKFVTVEVSGAASSGDAELCARTIANSLLCKTAWFGCDPNWGRVLAAAGRSGAKFSPENVSLDYDEMPVVRNGVDAGIPESELTQVLKRDEFSVKLNLGEGDHSFTVWTSDVSYEYVKINADYHT